MSLKMPTEAELDQIQRAFGEADIDHFVIKVDRKSPWIMVTAWDPEGAMLYLGLYRETGAVQRVDLTGTAPTAYPLIPPRWERLE